MSTDKKPRIDIEVSEEVFDSLVDIARAQKRSVRRQAQWILERYVAAKENDAS